MTTLPPLQPSTFEASGPVDLLRIHAALLARDSLGHAAVALAAEIAATLHWRQVTVGLLSWRGTLAFAGSSGVADPDPRHPAGAALVAAMHEAIDQGRSLAWPVPASAGDLLVAAQRQVAGSGCACTVPLAHAGEIVGAITAWREAAAGDADIRRLEDVAVLAAPVLAMRQQLASGWRERLAVRLRAALAQPGSWRLKAGIAAGLVAALAIPVPWRISAPARLEGAVQRAVVAATDGFIQQVNARPGERVRAGQVLVELATQDLELERRRRESELRQHETAYQAAQVRYDRTGMVASQAKAAEAQAMLALAEGNLERAHVSAPFDGIVIKGDLSQTLGAPVQRGEVLMVLAPDNRFRLVLEVDETDIGAVHPGQQGRLVLSSAPGTAMPFTVRRLVPVAGTADGRNFFEVEADVAADGAALRPGLSGVGKVEVGRRSLGGLLTYRLLDWARIASWTLLP